MGRRDVTIYTCDGCKKSSNVSRGGDAPGWYKVTTNTTTLNEYWVCTSCFGAIEWVVRFQGITRTPDLFKPTESEKPND